RHTRFSRDWSSDVCSSDLLVSVLPALVFGGTLVLMRKFDARHFLELAERHKVTHAMLVPVQYQRILAVPDFDQFDLSSFKVKLRSEERRVGKGWTTRWRSV